ncbi:MAG: hypothetical protein ACI9S8_001826 [Chlamydiales bacterium]|jgi:hypothetical protein
MIKEGYDEIEWKVIEDSLGRPSLSIGHRAIHSTYDAEGQATRWAKSIISATVEKGCNSIVLLGLGMGYLPRALYNEGFKDVIVWDPFPKMRQHIPYHGGEWKDVIPVASSFDTLTQFIHKQAKPNTKPYVVIHPGYNHYCDLEYRQILQFLQGTFRVSPESKLDKIVVSHRALESITLTPFFPLIDSLRGHFDDEKAILVSAGPSLKPCLPFLRERKEGILFAAVQAVPLLQRAGIKINYVVISDPQDLRGMLTDCTLDFDGLIAEAAVHPTTLEWCPEKTYLFNLPSDHLHRYIWPPFRGTNIRAPISTVSETQVLLSLTLNFQSLLMFGMDFCWKQERYSYRSPLSLSDRSREKYFRVATINGDIGETERSYFHASRYLNFICERVGQGNYTFFQHTEGLPISTAQQISPEEIPQILNKDREIVCPKYEHEVDFAMVSLAEMLLLEASESTHVTNNTGNLLTDSLIDLAMPFFKEIPIEDRQSICLAHALRLKEKINRMKI